MHIVHGAKGRDELGQNVFSAVAGGVRGSELYGDDSGVPRDTSVPARGARVHRRVSVTHPASHGACRAFLSVGARQSQYSPWVQQDVQTNLELVLSAAPASVESQMGWGGVDM